jgi:hypothetical protein
MPTLRRLAAVLAVLCLLAGGGYAIAQSAAEAAVAEAIARLRTALGPGAVIEHGAIRAEPIAGRVRISILTVSLDSGNAEAFIVSDVVIDGLRPGGAGFGRHSLHGIRILAGAEERGRIGSMTIEGLTLPAEPGFSLADIRLDSLDVLDVAIPHTDGLDGHALYLGYLHLGGIGGDQEDRIELSDLVILGPSAANRMSMIERLELARLEVVNARLQQAVLSVLEGRPPPVPNRASSALLRGLLVRAPGQDILRIDDAEGRNEEIEGQDGVLRNTLAVSGMVIGLPASWAALDGLDELRLTITGEGTGHQERGDFDVRSIRIEAEGLGVVDLGYRVTGAVLPPAGDPMENGQLHGLRLVFEESGLVARALAGEARRSGRTASEVRAQVAAGLDRLQALLDTLPPGAPSPEPKEGVEPPLPNSKFGPQPARPGTARSGQALRTLLDGGRRVTVIAAPARPVPFAEQARHLADDSPEALFRLLGVRIEVQ